MPIHSSDALAVLFRAPSSRQTRQKLKRSTMLVAALAFAPMFAQAQGLPTGGQVVAGTAGIAGSGGSLTVSQTSDKAVIDWSSFSVAKGNSVQFNNGTGATLNRVIGGNLSSIDGLLSATGSVYLINPNGVIIGKSGVVKVGGGFTASTLDIGNANFMAGGDLTLEGPSLASVVNLGQIGALGGDVALVAANVRNDGTVVAPNGALGLLAGSRVLMRDSAVNDGKFLVLSGGAGTSATNTGSIDAATAELRAEGGNVYALAGNTQGLIRATGVSTHDGRIFLSAGEGGSVEVSGSTLAATNNGEGGDISVTGQKITVASDATLDASGANQGGTVTAIADMASGQLDFHGNAIAKGSLNGGFIETSGRGVDFTGIHVDTTGAKSGNWLIDPDDLTVESASAATISSALATSNVTLQTTSTTSSGTGVVSTGGSGDITINSDISWSSANTLHLDSYHTVQVNANLTVSGAGGVVLSTNDGGSENGTGGGTGGDYYFALGKSLSFTGAGSLTINGQSYSLVTSLTGLAALSGVTGGYYALANSLDASGTTYTDAVVNTFGNSSTHAGTLTGLGHTIDKVNIAKSGGTVGFFNTNYGTVRDIGLSGGTVSGAGLVGTLISANSGTLANAWSSAAVNSTSNVAGGLVAINNSGAVISNAFSTGSVTNTFGSTGGLVGRNSGTITNTFSTSPISVNSGVNNMGGLVGWNQTGGSISNSFATGQITGGNTGLGGLVGQNNATVTNSYYDSSTTGRSDTGKGTAQTTAQLQGALPSGFSSSVWGTGTGLYPYLKTFFPNGVVAVSGTAYNSSSTAVSGATVALYSGGASLGTAYSGANGYYYIFVPTGTAGSTAGVTEALSGGSITGAAFEDATAPSGSNVTGLDVTSGTFLLNTSASSYATLKSEAAAAFGSTYYTSLLSTLSSAAYKVSAASSFNIDSALDTTSGTLSFKTLSGDLSLGTDLSVSGATALTLDGYQNLYINANLVASGTNAVTLNANNAGAGISGDYSFLQGKSLAFTNTAGAGQSLTINGNAYTLLYSYSDLKTQVELHSGNFALAKGLDFTSTPFTSQVVSEVDGTLTGLGNTITGLTINGTGNDNVALFGSVAGSGTVRDLGLNGGVIYGHYYSAPLVGENFGLVKNDWSSVDAHVTYRSGGLVGHNQGTILNSHATGAVTSLGSNGGVSDMGGLVGWNDFGTVSQSYATGTVTGTFNTTGGLVAFNDHGTVTDSFATGGVFGNDYAGGLVGFAVGGTISTSYSTGYVNATTHGGGLIGHTDGTTVTDSYWDTTTSGTNTGVGDPTNGSGTPTGMTRSALQNGSLPTNFSSSVWAVGSGLYPYLKSIFPTGMQSISGTTLDSSGAALPAATLAVYVAGTQVGGTTAASGADGYYYLMAQPGTVTNSTKIGITETDHNGASVTGLAYTDAPVLTSGQVTGFDVRSGRASYITADTSYANLTTNAGTTFGSGNYSTFTTALASADTYITGSNAFSFAANTSFGGALSVTATGGITLNGNLTATGAALLNSAVTLAADTTVAGSAVSFGSTVNGAHALTVNSSGATTFSGAVGGSTALASLVTDAAGTVTVGGDVTTSGVQTYNDAMTLGTDVSLTSGGLLNLAGTVNGAHALTLKGTDLSLGGVMGGSTPLTSLTGKATSGNISVGGVIHTTGSILLAANGTFSNTAGASALSAGTNFTVYTQNASDPTGTMPVNTFGGLTAGNYYNDAYNFTSGTFASAVPSGNHFVYAYAAKLTVTPDTKSLGYNGNIQSDSYGITGYLGSDASSDILTGSVTGLAATSKNATAYTITAGGTLASAQNYQVQYGSGTLTIDKAGLTLAAVTDSRGYNGDATSTGVVGVTGLQGTDTVTGKVQAFDSKNAGSRTLSVTGYTINDGNSGNNYTVTTQTAAGSIAKAALTIAAVTDSKTYDATTTSTGTVSVTGLKGTDTVTGKVQAFDSKNAGSRTLSVTGYTLNDGNSGGNYTVTTQTAVGSIAKAALTIAAGTDSKTYDTTTTSTGTVSVTGLKGSDTVTGKSQAFDSKNAGSRTLSVTGYTVNDGNSGGNYTVTTQTAAGSIAKAALTLTASTDSKTYDATTTSTGTVGVSGLKGSDTVTGKSQAFDSKNAGARTLLVNGYTVNDGNSGGNYTVTTQTASGTISKAALTAGLTGSTAKTYDATLSATLAANNYTLTGILGSDTVTLNNPVVGSYGDINVGTGKTVTVTGLALLGTDAGNYTVNGSASAAIGSISARPITLTANDAGKFVGSVDPALTYAITFGSLAGTDILTGGVARDTGENPGVYAINQGTLAASSNYAVTFVKGKFSIFAIALQNDPVVNPINTSTDQSSQPVIQPVPIGLNTAGGSASDASGTGSGTTDAGSAAGTGDETSGGKPCDAGTGTAGTDCANLPYPTNQSISSSITFASK
jgi:filamentous hemagglutinin family protein